MWMKLICRVVTGQGLKGTDFDTLPSSLTYMWVLLLVIRVELISVICHSTTSKDQSHLSSSSHPLEPCKSRFPILEDDDWSEDTWQTTILPPLQTLSQSPYRPCRSPPTPLSKVQCHQPLAQTPTSDLAIWEIQILLVLALLRILVRALVLLVLLVEERGGFVGLVGLLSSQSIRRGDLLLLHYD